MNVLSEIHIGKNIICATCFYAYDTKIEISYNGAKWQHKLGYGKCTREAIPLEDK